MNMRGICEGPGQELKVFVRAHACVRACVRVRENFIVDMIPRPTNLFRVGNMYRVDESPHRGANAKPHMEEKHKKSRWNNGVWMVDKEVGSLMYG